MNIQNLPHTLPVHAADGTILFPRTQLPLMLQRREEKEMADYALRKSNRLIGVVQSNPEGGHFQKGCLGRIINFYDGDPLYITLDGLCRFKVEDISEEKSFKLAKVNYEGYEEDMGKGAADPFVDRPRLLKLLKDYLEDQDITANWEEIHHASDDLIISSLSMLCPFKPIEKQALLEVDTLSERCDMMIALMEMATPQLKGQQQVLH